MTINQINNRVCEYCGVPAQVYAMDTISGGWGGRYCNDHIPTRFVITDRFDNQKDKTTI